MIPTSRRNFIRQSLTLGAAAALAGPLGELRPLAGQAKTPRIKLGLCTYQWGNNWDLPTLLANCEKAGLLGIELRTGHKHGVDLKLGQPQREEVKKRFADSPITFVGVGSAEGFDSPDPERLKRSIEATKQYARLSRDCGGSGVKVRPNNFHDKEGVPHEKTIEQIGKSLNVVGRYAADFGQQIRLEVHGTCQDLPVIKQIMDIADHPNVTVCWNCNSPNNLQPANLGGGGDLGGKGLKYNFDLVKNRLGDVIHIHELNLGNYPYSQLFPMLVKANFSGWALLECSTTPKDLVAAMAEQRTVFESMLADAEKSAL